MKILFTTNGDNWSSKIESRFGRTRGFLIYDEEKGDLNYYDNSNNANAAHGAGTQTSSRVIDLGVDLIITGNMPGNKAKSMLDNYNIKILSGAHNMTIEAAYKAYKNQEL